jgi:hypothetical protein
MPTFRQRVDRAVRQVENAAAATDGPWRCTLCDASPFLTLQTATDHELRQHGGAQTCWTAQEAADGAGSPAAYPQRVGVALPGPTEVRLHVEYRWGRPSGAAHERLCADLYATPVHPTYRQHTEAPIEVERRRLATASTDVPVAELASGRLTGTQVDGLCAALADRVCRQVGSKLRNASTV